MALVTCLNLVAVIGPDVGEPALVVLVKVVFSNDGAAYRNSFLEVFFLPGLLERGALRLFLSIGGGNDGGNACDDGLHFVVILFELKCAQILIVAFLGLIKAEQQINSFWKRLLLFLKDNKFAKNNTLTHKSI